MTTADECRAMGLRVGDTIEGIEVWGDAGWSTARLTLLWLGEEVAVFRVTQSSSQDPDLWTRPSESGNWRLFCRRWKIIARAAGND